MEQYIKKSALVAEIERRLEKIANASSEDNRELSAINGAQQYELINLIQYINTLEVKEVNLEKEAERFVQTKEFVESKESPILVIAKHFFELGLNSQTKDMQDALRMEYEKGRADVIADTLSWLANCWPQYCSNPNIIDGFKEAIQYD